MSKSLLEKYKITSFNDIIGQNNNINFIKNSLFKNSFYPLYLFSGMRGSGKTTSARLFSASLLCHSLKKFQLSPLEVQVPCYNCQSCILYSKNQHPDIIELDAASHTGVDTIRSIIDNAYMLPIISEKKVYIIDEVHMLSKAAFNACLKIMEEPPLNVHFILATTEPQKVLETIKSRSIILHYKPIANNILYDYIKKITTLELINIEDDAILSIVDLSEGSVRDSINILNRMIFIDNIITKDIIVAEYGIIDKTAVENLLNAILNNDIKEYYIQKNTINISELSKKKIFELAIHFIQKKLEINIMNKNNESVKNIKKILYDLYQYEEFFYTSNNSLTIFDLLLNSDIESGMESNIENKKTIILKNNSEINIENKKKLNATIDIKNEFIKNNNEILDTDDNNIFLNNLDTVIKTIFSQGQLNINRKNKKIIINFKKNFLFYKTFLEKNNTNIQQAIQNTFQEYFSIEYNFNINEVENKENTEKKTNIIYNNDIIKNKDSKAIYVNTENLSSNKKKNEELSPLLKKINDLVPGITYYK